MSNSKRTFKLEQLALNLSLKDDASFANFYTDANVEVVNFLQNLTSLDKTNRQIIYLWGESGCGKSHLLAATCQQCNECGQSAAYLPLSEYSHLAPQILEDLGQMSLLCIDDLDKILKQRSWEEAIFHSFNLLQNQNTHIIFTATKAPQALNFCLPDLQSRVASGIIFRLHALTDDQKLEVLQLRANALGLQLSDKAALFMLNHCQRDTKTLFTTLKKLDVASLAAQRSLTIPFIKEVLGI